MNDCIFCKIINKELPADVVYEDGNVLAIKTIVPVSEGHTLVIPKRHYENILDIDEQALGYVAQVSRELAPKLKDQHGATGINLLHAAGKDAQQSVFHFHLHIVPRYENDGLDLWFKSGIEKKEA